MSRFKKWRDLEGQPISFDVNSTTEEAMQATDHPSRIHLTTDGRVVMNGVILGDRNPKRGKWDGRVVINKDVPCYARAGMAYYFSDGLPKFKFTKEQANNIVAKYANTDTLCPTEFVGLTGFVTNNGWGLIMGADQIEATTKVKEAFREFLSDKEHDFVTFDKYKRTKDARTYIPVIVRILKDGDIFEDGKYTVTVLPSSEQENIVSEYEIKTMSPNHVIRNGKILYTAIPNIVLHKPINMMDNARLKVFVHKKKPLKYFNNPEFESKGGWYYKRIRVRRMSSDRVMLACQLQLRSCKGRRQSIYPTPTYVCRFDNYQVIPLKVYTGGNRKGLLLI